MSLIQKSKRGQIEIQFNWIYIAVVGGVLLLMFVNIANGIRNSSQQKLEYEAINYFDEIFTSMQGSENTEHSITLPGMDIAIDTAKTGKDQCIFYQISKSETSRQSIIYLPVFSPDLIKKKVISYSLGWDIPFRVNHFLYLTSPEEAYVFVGDASSLKSDLPKNMNKLETGSTSDFVNQNYYKVRFILRGDVPGTVSSSVARLKDTDVTAISINPESPSNIYGFGEVKYYQKKGSQMVETGSETGTSYYMDKATLFAAIYSQSKDSYECNLMKAMDRLNKVSYLLKERAQMIKGSELISYCEANQDRCKCVGSYYSNAYDNLETIQHATESFVIDSNSMKSLRSISTTLESLNEQLNKESCPTIY